MATDTLKTLLTVASIAIAFYFGIKTANRNSLHDYSNDKSHVVKLDAGLEEIGRNIKDIKADMVKMRDGINDTSAGQKAMEAQVKHMTGRLDTLEQDIRNLRNNCMTHKGGSEWKT